MASIVDVADVAFESDWPAKHLRSPSGVMVAQPREWVDAPPVRSGLAAALARLAADGADLDGPGAAALCRRAYEGSVRPLLDLPRWQSFSGMALSS